MRHATYTIDVPDARQDAFHAVTNAVHAAAAYAEAFDGLATFSLTDVLARLCDHSGRSHRFANALLVVAERAGAIRATATPDERGRPVWALADTDALYDALAATHAWQDRKAG
jgi:hypothetical protein